MQIGSPNAEKINYVMHSNEVSNTLKLTWAELLIQQEEKKKKSLCFTLSVVLMLVWTVAWPFPASISFICSCSKCALFPNSSDKNWSHLSYYVGFVGEIPRVQKKKKKRVCCKHSKTDFATNLELWSGQLSRPRGQQIELLMQFCLPLLQQCQ